MGTKESRAQARAAGAAALLEQAEAVTTDTTQDPMVLLALMEQARRLAITAGNQECAERMRAQAKVLRKSVVAAEATKLGFRVVVRRGSTDHTLAKVRIPEDEVPEQLADDLAEAFMAVLERHGIEIE